MIDNKGGYTHFAFKTSKGVFTLIGSSREVDEFRELGTCNFHKWKRLQIKEWSDSGKITPIEESTYLSWFEKK